MAAHRFRGILRDRRLAVRTLLLCSAAMVLLGADCQSFRWVLPAPPRVTTSTARVGPEDSLTVQFEAVASDPDGGDVRFLWTFTDGTISRDALTIHAFSGPGTYRVSLQVVDDEGATTGVTLTLTVPLTSGAVVSAPTERSVPNEGEVHLPTGTAARYRNNPPASGPHWSEPGLTPVSAGFYDEVLPPERWVHNLEHGYIVYLYDCDGPCDTRFLNQLRTLFDSTPPSKWGNRKLVITRYPGLEPFMMAVAWEVQMDLETFDAAALTSFYQRRVDRGPEDVP